MTRAEASRSASEAPLSYGSDRPQDDSDVELCMGRKEGYDEGGCEGEGYERESAIEGGGESWVWVRMKVKGRDKVCGWVKVHVKVRVWDIGSGRVRVRAKVRVKVRG